MYIVLKYSYNTTYIVDTYIVDCILIVRCLCLTTGKKSIHYNFSAFIGSVIIITGLEITQKACLISNYLRYVDAFINIKSLFMDTTLKSNN